MPPNPAGQPATPSTTAPAGSRETQSGTSHPAQLRRRTAELVTRSAALGQRMRRSDAYAAVLVWSADADDTTADGWESWLHRRFNPTPIAADHNGIDAARMQRAASARAQAEGGGLNGAA